MILELVWRSLRFAPGRTLLMLGGYSLGVGVMVALLSIGDAMVEQSRVRDLVGGGDLAVLPAGLDLETLRTGGVSSLYFDIDLARFFYRQVLAGPRLSAPPGPIVAAAPWLDDELLYIRLPESDSVVAVSAGGQIPSRAEALDVAPDLVTGSWTDQAADGLWMDPPPDVRLAQVDGFHLPPAGAAGDSSWAEWHYFNILAPDGERWLYLTWLVGGDVGGGRRGGRLLATLVEPGGDRAWERLYPADEVDFAPGRVEVRAGPHSVRVRDGVYLLRIDLPPAGDLPALLVDLEVVPSPHRYLPAVDVSPGTFPSGYAVPVLRGVARGRVCSGGACSDWTGGRAYHDHNWGVWRNVAWDWGQFQLGSWSILYGGISRDTTRGAPASGDGDRVLFAVDSLGLAGVLPIRSIEYVLGPDGVPVAVELEAARGEHLLRLRAEVAHARATIAADPGGTDVFLQMRGSATVEGRLPVGPVDTRGDGFFETWQRRPERRGD